jgi:hypothetical protein
MEDRAGCQSHSGQRMRLNTSSWSGLIVVPGVRSRSGPRFKAHRGGVVGSGAIMPERF